LFATGDWDTVLEPIRVALVALFLEFADLTIGVKTY